VQLNDQGPGRPSVCDGGRRIRYNRATPGRTPDDPPDSTGKYPPGATGLVIGEDSTRFVGTSQAGLFYYRHPADDPQVDEVLADFLRYENEQGRVPFLFAPDGFDIEGRAAHAMAMIPPLPLLRPSDPLYLVHSTSRAAGDEIRRDGAVFSYALLCEQGRAPQWHRLRSAALGEPAEFADQINLGRLGDPWVEVVPASHVVGRFLGPDDPYEPGWRFYFDTRKLLESGRAIRWCGAIKVRRMLPLAGVCVALIDAAAVAARRGDSSWTPRRFTREADQILTRQLGQGVRL
jgi:hypothetical protein